jgi:cytoskeletal protein CcmA (bactofilin family)
LHTQEVIELGRKKRQREPEVSVFLGGDSNLEGELKFSGQARLDGAFHGRITGSGVLLVGPAARVEADVSAAAVIISGEVVGNVTATDRIELHAPGKLRGNINAPLVVMDEGVLFEGHCSMAGEEAGERAPKITLLASGEK